MTARDGIAPDLEVARLAERQHGVVDLAQLRAAGLGRGAIDLRLRSGRLHRLHRGVFAVGHARVSREGRWLAAVLALGPGAALSHTSAAALWELRRTSAAAIHVTVPTAGGRSRRARILVHRSVTLRAADIEERDGIAVTSVARTLLDLAGMVSTGALERSIERSLALRLFDRDAILAAIERDPRREGAGALARMAVAADDEPALTRSQLEARMLDLCDAHAIARPEVNAIAAGHEVDFLWRGHRLVVEADGHEDHGTRIAFERDRARDAHLMLHGLRVLRVTYRRLVDEPREVAATVRALLASPAPAAGERGAHAPGS